MLKAMRAEVGLCFVKEGQEKRGREKGGGEEEAKKERGGRYIPIGVGPSPKWSLPSPSLSSPSRSLPWVFSPSDYPSPSLPWI